MRAPSKKTSLNSEVRVSWVIGPDLDPGLVHGHQEVGQSVVTRGAGLGPAHHEAPVGLVGQRRPHLLAGDDPLVAVELGTGGHVGQVAAGVRLRVSLAPQLGAVHDPGQEAVLLGRCPVLDQRRTEQALAQDAHPARRPGLHVLLVEDHLLGDGRTPPAEVHRPAQAGPAAGGQHVLPLESDLETVGLVAGPAPSAEGGEVPDHVVGHPGLDLLAEGLVLGSVSEVHGRGSWGGGAPVRAIAGGNLTRR